MNCRNFGEIPSTFSMAYKNDEPNGSKSFSYRWDDKLMFGKMRTFHICSLFVVFSVSSRINNSFLFQIKNL